MSSATEAGGLRDLALPPPRVWLHLATAVGEAAAGPEATARVTVARGTRAAGAADAAGPAYAAGARIPDGHWQPLDAAVGAGLRQVPADAGPDEVIRLLHIPAAVTAPFRAIGPGDAADGARIAAWLRSPAGAAAEREAVAFARTLLARGDDCVTIGCTVHGPGQCTTTVDPAVGQRIGLHVDSWDGWNFAAPGGPRPRRTRLCINLATTPRFLLFMRLAITDVWSLASPADRQLGPTPLLQAFLRANPAVPVYRLEVRPGEGYIAPVDAMPHDASTLGSRGTDLSLSLIGHFDALAA